MPPSIELDEARQRLVQAEQDAEELALQLARNGGDSAVVGFLKNLAEAYDREKQGWPMPESVFRCSRALTLYDQYKDARAVLARTKG